MRFLWVAWVAWTVSLVPGGFVCALVGIVGHSQVFGGLSGLAFGSAAVSGLGMVMTHGVFEVPVPARRAPRAERREVEAAQRRIRVQAEIRRLEREAGIRE